MPRERFSIICDDIRFEQGNKVSLIGVYTNGILVPKFPHLFLKLCLAQQFEDAANTKKLRCVLLGPKVNVKAEATTQDPSKPVLRVTMAFTNFEVFEEGDYRFETYFDGDETPGTIKQFYIRLRPELRIV